MIRASVISYASFLSQFVSSVVVSRLLGVAGKGAFSLFVATAVGLIVLAGIGVPQGQMYHASREPRWLSHFMSNGTPLGALSGFAVAAGYLILGSVLHFAVANSAGAGGALGILIVVPTGVLLIYQRQYFLTLTRFELAKAAGTASVTLPLVGYAILALLHCDRVEAFVAAYVGAQVLCFAIFQFIQRRTGPRQLGFSVEFARRSASFGLWQYISNIASYLVSRVDFFVVALYLGARGVGIYSVAAGLAEIVIRVAAEVGTMLYPVFASGELEPDQSAAAVRIVLFASAAIGLALAGTSNFVLHILYGPKFGEAAPALRWLMLGAVAWSTIHITWTYVSSTGRPQVGALVFTGCAVVDVGLNMWLLPRLGVIGASISASIAYLAGAAVFLLLFCRASGCSTWGALIPTAADARRLYDGLVDARRGLPGVFRLRRG